MRKDASPIRVAAPLAAALLLASCAASEPESGTAVTSLEAPAAPGAGEPSLFAAPDGSVYLSWLEPVGAPGAAASTSRGAFAVRFATLDASGAWSEPRTIASGDDFFVNWADFPSLVRTSDGALVAHWLQRTGGNTYAYAVRTARSTDGGATWTGPLTPHGDDTPTEHGFVTLLPDADGAVDAFWLDGRHYAEAEAAGEPESGQMALRHARLLPDGTQGPETVLDARTCDCCQTAAARTEEGLVVVYRDRSEEEVRDIYVTRQVGGGWSEPRPVHADGWTISACPVNGPQLAASGRTVAAAWFTAAQDAPRVHVAFSTDAGATFGAPVRVDGGDPVGRVDVELVEDGSALVSWVERTAEGAEVRARRVAADGTLREPVVVTAIDAGRASGFPRMARVGDEVLFAWTEPGTPSQVRMARLRL